jgi:hypothetical protein
LLETSSGHPTVKLEGKHFSEVIQSFIQLQILIKHGKLKTSKSTQIFIISLSKLFTRSLCPDCAQKAYDELDENGERKIATTGVRIRGKIGTSLVVRSRQAVEHSLGCDRPLGARTVGNFQVLALTAISPFVKAPLKITSQTRSILLSLL